MPIAPSGATPRPTASGVSEPSTLPAARSRRAGRRRRPRAARRARRAPAAARGSAAGVPASVVLCSSADHDCGGVSGTVESATPPSSARIWGSRKPIAPSGIAPSGIAPSGIAPSGIAPSGAGSSSRLGSRDEGLGRHVLELDARRSRSPSSSRPAARSSPRPSRRVPGYGEAARELGGVAVRVGGRGGDELTIRNRREARAELGVSGLAGPDAVHGAEEACPFAVARRVAGGAREELEPVLEQRLAVEGALDRPRRRRR